MQCRLNSFCPIVQLILHPVTMETVSSLKMVKKSGPRISVSASPPQGLIKHFYYLIYLIYYLICCSNGDRTSLHTTTQRSVSAFKKQIKICLHQSKTELCVQKKEERGSSTVHSVCFYRIVYCWCLDAHFIESVTDMQRCADTFRYSFLHKLYRYISQLDPLRMQIKQESITHPPKHTSAHKWHSRIITAFWLRPYLKEWRIRVLIQPPSFVRLWSFFLFFLPGENTSCISTRCNEKRHTDTSTSKLKPKNLGCNVYFIVHILLYQV